MLVLQQQKAFTLLELMMVTAILAIIASFSVPAFNRMIDDNRLSQFGSDLSWTMLYARSEAIKRNQNIVIEKIGTDWSTGWRVTLAGNALEVFEANGDINPSGPDTITFLPNGRPQMTGADFFVLKIDDSKAPMRCVFINQTGMATVLVDRDDDGNCANG